ncbi:hypothetical protein Tco_0159256, partial [Tanacetum coccineum]
MATSGRALNEIMKLSGEIEIPKCMKFFFMQQIAEEKVFANLLCDQCDDVRRHLTNLYVMIREMEALEDRLVVFDSLECWRKTQQKENNKLAALTEMLIQTKD